MKVINREVPTLKFQLKPFLLFSILFILFVPIGTLSHELGHGAAIKLFGHTPTLHYASIDYDFNEKYDRIDELYFENKKAIDSGNEFGDQLNYEALVKEINSDSFWITAGGPIQTTAFGTIAFFILLYLRKGSSNNNFKNAHWSLVFISLFWLREIFNPTLSILTELNSPDGTYFGGDERKLALQLDWWEGSIALTLGIIGSIFCITIIFKLIPKFYRFTFILSGLVGGCLGYIIWLQWIGPIVLP